jgi:hypothetical protein
MKFLRQILITLALSASANAQLASLQIDAVSPSGGQSGTTTEVSMDGQDLDELKNLLFTHPGITGEHLEGNRFKITIADDVPADFYEVRVTGKFGLSNARPFEVSALPQMTEAGAHQTAESAVSLPFDTFVNGTADADALDVYKFTATAGQRVFVECTADRLDSKMDATLVLSDASGVELLRDRDSDGRDPFLDFTAPAAGDYFVAVHDFQFKGGSHYFYRLLLNRGAHIDYILPPSGTPGKRERFTVFGRNLPGGEPVANVLIDGLPIERKEIEIDVPKESDGLLSRAIAAVAVKGTGVHVKWAHRPAHLALAQAPVALEREPNNSTENAQLISVPCEVGGQFFPASDNDWFEFDGRKGQVYWIEVFSERLGDATDPFLVVQKITWDGEGKEDAKTVLESDDLDEKAGAHIFPGRSRDARGTFTADADARYRVMVREQFSGEDPRHVYRLVIREPQPDFSLIVGVQQFTDEGDQMSRATPYLRRGGSRQLKVIAHRRDGFNGPIEINVENLPTGVKAQACAIPAGANESTLTLTANSDAADFVGQMNVVGTGDLTGKKVTRSAYGASLLWGVGNWKQEFTSARLNADVPLAVSGTEQAPVVLSPAEDKVYATSLAGKLEIPLQLTRRDNLKDNATIQPIGLPGLKKPINSQIDNNAKETKLVLDFAKKDGNEFKPGEYTIFAQATGVLHYRANLEAELRAEAAKNECDAVVAKIDSEHKAAGEQCDTLNDELAKIGEDTLTADTAEKQKAEKQQALEKTAITRDEKAKALEAAKKLQAESVTIWNQAKERAKPRERRFHSLSQPIRIRIASAPVRLPELPQQSVKPEAQVELPLQVERLFGFNEAIEITAATTDAAKGLSLQPVSIAKDSSEAKLIISAGKDTTPGDKELRVDAKLKLNGEELMVSRTLKIRVDG